MQFNLQLVEISHIKPYGIFNRLQFVEVRCWKYVVTQISSITPHFVRQCSKFWQYHRALPFRFDVFSLILIQKIETTDSESYNWSVFPLSSIFWCSQDMKTSKKRFAINERPSATGRWAGQVARTGVWCNLRRRLAASKGSRHRR